MGRLRRGPPQRDGDISSVLEWSFKQVEDGITEELFLNYMLRVIILWEIFGLWDKNSL